MMSDRRFGRVVWFKDHKGFGFIRPDNSDEDIFFHWSYLKVEGYKTIKPNAKVSFELGSNHKGVMATNIAIESED
jgi:cold shock protein